MKRGRYLFSLLKVIPLHGKIIYKCVPVVFGWQARHSQTGLFHRVQLLKRPREKERMKKIFSGTGKILKNTYTEWSAADPFRQSAVIAYYAIFSLPALLVLVINLAGFFFGKEKVSDEITRQVEAAMGSDAARQIGDVVDNASRAKAGVISSIIAVLTIIVGATGVFVQLQKSLNRIWQVKEKPNLGVMKTLKDRLFSFGLIISIGFLLLMSLVISSGLAAFSNWLESVFPDFIAYLMYALEFIVSLAVISVLFALMFKLLPDVKMRWRNVWVGSVITALLFMLGKYALSLYFGKAHPGSVYGAAGTVVLILLWSSYSSMIVFFGAEFTRQFALYHGVKITPASDAVHVEQQEVIKKPDGTKVTHVKEEAVREEEGKTYSHEHGKKKEEKSSSDKTPEDKKQRAVRKHPEHADRRRHKVKSMKDLHEKIHRMEQRLEEDKEEIKDELKIAQVLSGLVPAALTVKKAADEALSVDDYLKKIAHHFITPKTDNLVDKVKNIIHPGKE